jgi:PST family polysaccharide transporter
MWLSLAQSVFFTIFAKLIIKILYGADFMPAVPVLQILVWNTAFSYMGYVRNIWILGEEKHGELWKINLGGAIASIALNCWMIPLWGACGAAAASVLTQIFTNVIMGLVLRPIRRNSALQIRGLDPRLLVEMARMLLPAGKEAAEESQ